MDGYGGSRKGIAKMKMKTIILIALILLLSGCGYVTIHKDDENGRWSHECKPDWKCQY
jgi:uncharacterized protein YceK